MRDFSGSSFTPDASPLTPSSSGIALVFVAGILTLFVLMAAACGRMAALEAQGSKADLARVRAAVAAESGMAYAAARLTRERADMSVPRTVAARGDDWQYRGGGGYRYDPDLPEEFPVPESLGETRNPSYAHGEHWQDAGWYEGSYEAPDDILAPGVWTDLDGDGRMSAWSGRLRGPLGPTFALQVEPGPSCRINVNGGDLDIPWIGHNYGMTNEEGGDGGGESTGAPSSEEIAFALNALGVTLGVGEIVEIPPAGSERPVKVSDIGNRLLAHRPLGTGYRSYEEMRQALRAGAFPLSDGDWRRLEPHLTLVDFEDGVTVQEFATDDKGATDLLDLQGASPAILNAYWMYRLAAHRSTRLAYDASNVFLPESGTSETDPWTGLPFGTSMTFFPEEIRPIAAGIVRRRRTGVMDTVYTLHREALEGFRAHGHGPTAGPGMATDGERDLWLSGKASAFVAFTRQRGMAVTYLNEGLVHIPPRSWSGRGLDAEGSMAGQCGSIPFPDTGAPYDESPYDAGGGRWDLEWPHKGFWLGPIRSFRVESLGADRGAPGGGGFSVRAGDLQAGVGIRFFSQDHFENLYSRRNGVTGDIDPPLPRPMAGGITRQGLGRFGGTQSLPRIYPLKSFWAPDFDYGSLTSGGVTLAEGGSDFQADPMLFWEFMPDTDLDDDPQSMTDGGRHCRGTGKYPFTDNAPNNPPLFFAGQAFDAWGAGSLEEAVRQYPATKTSPTVGAGCNVGQYWNNNLNHWKNNAWVLGAGDAARMYPGPVLFLPDPARVPAPLPMLPFRNSRNDLIEPLLWMPLNQGDEQDQFDYPPDDHQPRWWVEGGVEAWVCTAAPQVASNLPGAFYPPGSTVHWRLCGRCQGGVDGMRSIALVRYQGRYRLICHYSLESIRIWDSFFHLFQSKPVYAGPFGHEILLAEPERDDPWGIHYDHILVEWIVRKALPYDPVDPTGLSQDVRDQMPRVEVNLRVTINGKTVVHPLPPQVTTTSYVLDAGGQIDLSQGEILFEDQLGFVPPISWDPEVEGGVTVRENSFLGIELRHCDQVALYGMFGGAPRTVFKDRFRAEGDYESPRVVVPPGATLRWAGWSAAMNGELRGLADPPVSCGVEGFLDEGAGLSAGGEIPVGTLAAPCAWLDIGGVRSAKFRVRFRIPTDPAAPLELQPKVIAELCDDPVVSAGASVPGGTGAFVDPPVFEEFNLFVGMPRWLSRE